MAALVIGSRRNGLTRLSFLAVHAVSAVGPGTVRLGFLAIASGAACAVSAAGPAPAALAGRFRLGLTGRSLGRGLCGLRALIGSLGPALCLSGGLRRIPGALRLHILPVAGFIRSDVAGRALIHAVCLQNRRNIGHNRRNPGLLQRRLCLAVVGSAFSGCILAAVQFIVVIIHLNFLLSLAGPKSLRSPTRRPPEMLPPKAGYRKCAAFPAPQAVCHSYICSHPAKNLLAKCSQYIIYGKKIQSARIPPDGLYF